jgi:hypothetical protein
MPHFAGTIVARALNCARPLVLAFALASAAACGGSADGVTGPSPSEQKPTPNFIQLRSDPGDYVGAGASYDYTQANALIKVTVTAGHLAIQVTGDQWWVGDIAMPGGASFKAGTYSNLTRYPFNTTAEGGLSWSGEGSACNTLSGSVTIDSVTYTGGNLTAIDLKFEQHCGGAAAALRATIHWRSDDTTGSPGPITPIPSTLWKPDATALPASGNYVLLSSDPGDPVGLGIFKVYTPPTSPFTVSSTGSRITVDVGGFTGNFEAMLGTNPIKVGYYGGLQRWPSNPLKGGLFFSGNGRACNTSTGWFAVDKVLYVGTTMTALDLRFEQHCQGGAAAIRGAIHWTT